jgi:hypothetical protein
MEFAMKSLDGSTSPRRLSSRATLWLLIALGLSVRFGYWSDLNLHPNHGFPNFYLAFGTPCSDALGWIQMGNAVREGWAGEHSWAARRPLYGFILGSIYCWTDPRNQAWIAQFLNVVLSGITVGLIYTAGYSVLGRVPALAAALWFCFDSNSICHSTVTLSENVGTFFTAWHLALLAAASQGNRGCLAGSGLCFAAANLARTLSLFSFPTHCLLLAVIRWRASGSIWRAIWDASIFGGFASLLLLVAMVRNYYVVGIFTISDNTASILYAATSPNYGTWTSAVEEEANRLGIHNLKDRYRFYMDKARANLAEHADLYVSRVFAQTKLVMRDVLSSPFADYLFMFVAGTIVLQAGWSIYQATWLGAGGLRQVLYIAVIIPLASVLLFPPVSRFSWIYLLALLPVIRSIIRNDAVIMHANLFFFSVLGVSGFGEYGVRFNLLFDFILAGMVFAGLSMIVGGLARIIMNASADEFSRADESLGRGLHRALSLGVLSIIAMGVAGIPDKRIPELKPFPMSSGVASQAVEQAIASLPDSLQRRIRDKYQTQGEPIGEGETGRVIVVSGRLLGPATYAPANAAALCQFDCFKPRDYPRTILMPAGWQSNGKWRSGSMIFAGTLPNDFINRPMVVVGIDRGYDSGNFSANMDAVAVFPWNENGKDIDWSAGKLCNEPHHLRMIDSLLPAPKP